MVSVAEPSFVVFALLPSRIFTLLDLDLLRAWALVVYPPCLTCTCLRSESSCNSASSHYWSSDLVRRWFTDCCLLKFFKNSINIYIPTPLYPDTLTLYCCTHIALNLYTLFASSLMWGRTLRLNCLSSVTVRGPGHLEVLSRLLKLSVMWSWKRPRISWQSHADW